MLSLLSLNSLLFACGTETEKVPETTFLEQSRSEVIEEGTAPSETEAAQKLISVAFENVEPIRVTVRGTYPRLYKLSDGTLLCGIDGYCFRSEDDGLT